MLPFETEPTVAVRVAPDVADLDAVLTTQFAVAWAGEGGDEPRLGWWDSQIVSYGGMDLLKRLLPHTWEWATFQAAREVAVRQDAELRRHAHDPDRLVSLFRLGFEIDERIDGRLRELKHLGPSPFEALPALGNVVQATWSNHDRFVHWVERHGDVVTTQAPAGRLIKGPIPPSLRDQIRVLVASLAPLSARYPLPHFRRAQ